MSEGAWQQRSLRVLGMIQSAAAKTVPPISSETDAAGKTFMRFGSSVMDAAQKDQTDQFT
ncbi:hypothetical protein [Bradyrhizobium valentinum]|uniref:hypothetical protein n=1 Tax=Bradyrhizobium valentinum TaxID=1518501 RepID=UPI0012E38276|nr:hypothetical protein [Bradyrhizobium valentinum]